MTALYSRDYFAVNIKLLKLGFLWYPEELKRASDLFSYLLTAFCISLIALFYTPSEVVSLSELLNDVNAFINNLGIVLTHFTGCIKLINFCYRRRQIKEMMEVLQGEDLEYEVTEDFKPNVLIHQAKQKNYIFSLLFLGLVHLVLWTNYLMAIFNFIFHEETFYSLDKDGNQVFCKILPFYSWLPFDHSTKTTCLLAMLCQFIPLLMLSFVIVSTDTLFMGFINFVTAHLLVLDEAFKTIPSRCIARKKKYDVLNLDEEMHKDMKKCVNHLNVIFRVCDGLEEVYKFQTLAQVLVTLFVTCTCLFLLATETVGSKTFYVQLFYVTAIQAQITLYCWFGNELTLASEKIPNSLFESEWLSASIRFKKATLMTMRRMQRPIILTVGNFSPLTLDTFVMILRGSYSLFAVLKKKNSIE